jgi:membrane fusion protein (multidrug efflux system)
MRIFACSIILCWCIIFLTCCSNKPADQAVKEKDETSVSLKESYTPVTTALSEFRSFDYLINSNGKIKSMREQLITSESGGRLLQLNAKTGLSFSTGSIIARMETTVIEHKLEKAKLAQFNNQKEFESQLLGYENLLKGKTKEQADTIRQKIKISTGLAGAEQEIKEANYELTKSIIRAPFNGILADLKVQEGEHLRPGQELFRIYDPHNLFLEIKILEADVSLLKKGMISIISPLSTPERQFKAEVFEINPYVDENGMVLVKLKIKNQLSSSGNDLFPGMHCTTTIRIPLGKCVIVPKESLVMRSGKTVVFSLEDAKAKWNYVTVGKANDKEVEIKAGLKPGMKIITSNNLQLADDAPVQENGIPATN